MTEEREKTNRGRSDEARDPNRPTYVDEETGETEKEGLGPREGHKPKPEEEAEEPTTETPETPAEPPA